MLSLFGSDLETWPQWTADRLRDDEGQIALLSVLYAVRRFELVDIDRWALSGVTWQQLQANPDRYRGEFVHLSGTLASLEPISPPAPLAARFELRTYYRCQIEVGEPAIRTTVFALEVPRAWTAAGQGKSLVGQPVDFQGLFLGNSVDDAAAPAPVFVTPRLAWKADDLLGRLGMDAGLFDKLENRHPLSRAERESFYQLLAACERADKQELELATQGAPSDVVPLFNAPDTQHGKLVAIEGTARRAVPILVEEPDLVERFGIREYYEVEVFSDDSQGNPIVCCLLELPEGFPQGDRIAERIRVPAFFLKTWAYRSAGAGEGKLQLAPLLVGRTATWIRPPAMSRNWWLGLTLGLLFLVALTGLWLTLWLVGRSDRHFEAARRAKDLGEQGAVDLDRLVAESEGDEASGHAPG